jgi:peptidoglycan/LPS O-acetylase OafA/YrhL
MSAEATPASGTPTPGTPTPGTPAPGPPAPGNQTPERTGSLDGLRGLAALQVIAMHYATAFLPGAATRNPAQYRHAWESAIANTPLYFLVDGFTAVYVFFLISGGVLTLSFRRTPRAILLLAASRAIRLGVPVAAAGLLALVLTAAAPQAHRIAAGLIGSDTSWLATDGASPTTLAHLFRDVTLNAIFLGYAGVSLFAPSWSWLQPMTVSLDAPSWTMHLEFYGSLLVLVLVALRSVSHRLYWCVVAAIAAAWLPVPLFLFVIGHWSAGLVTSPPRGRAFAACGAALVAVGIAAAASKDWAIAGWLQRGLDRVIPNGAPNLFQFQSQLAAIMIYFGVLLCPPVRRLLAKPGLRRLGSLSFSLYLVHFPILFTVTSVAAIHFSAVLPLDAALAAASLAGLTVTAGIALGFERFVDRPAIAASRRLRLVRHPLTSSIARPSEFGP